MGESCQHCEGTGRVCRWSWLPLEKCRDGARTHVDNEDGKFKIVSHAASCDDADCPCGIEWAPPSPSKLVEHAERELELLGSEGEPDEWMAKGLLELVEAFATQGHSGGSAGYAIRALNRLLNFKPLTSLRGGDDEWRDVSQYGGGIARQNIRCPSVMERSDGTCLDVDARVDVVEFPYTPEGT